MNSEVKAAKLFFPSRLLLLLALQLFLTKPTVRFYVTARKKKSGGPKPF